MHTRMCVRWPLMAFHLLKWVFCLGELARGSLGPVHLLPRSSGTSIMGVTTHSAFTRVLSTQVLMLAHKALCALSHPQPGPQCHPMNFENTGRGVEPPRTQRQGRGTRHSKICCPAALGRNRTKEAFLKIRTFSVASRNFNVRVFIGF